MVVGGRLLKVRNVGRTWENDVDDKEIRQVPGLSECSFVFQ